LSSRFLTDSDAKQLADDIAFFLGIEPVALQVVEQLDDGQGGVYIPARREILIRRPADPWTVAHEMAHVVSTGHGEDFIEALLELARWLDQGRRPSGFLAPGGVAEGGSPGLDRRHPVLAPRRIPPRGSGGGAGEYGGSRGGGAARRAAGSPRLDRRHPVLAHVQDFF